MGSQKANPENTSHYLGQIQAAGVTPNFWTSAEYLICSESKWDSIDGLSGFRQEDDEWLLPPLNSAGLPVVERLSIYAGWPTDDLPEEFAFLDHQFLYQPSDFTDLTGGVWQTFRKNIRKFPARTVGVLSYQRLLPDENIPLLGEFVSQWAQGKEVYDPDTLVRFVLQGDNRKGLWVDRRLVGINVWDANFQFINFRYCIDDGRPFLNEYLRYLFYTDAEIQASGKMVNDGGSLGSDALYRFKCKLNPRQILKVSSYGRTSNAPDQS